MIKNATIYRTGAGWNPDLAAMETALQAALFVPCGATQNKSVGWVSPRGEANGALVESIAGQRIMQLRIETKGVPGSVVRKKAQEAADHIEATIGRKPGKKETKALREEALLALLPQAFPKTVSVWVWVDPAAGLLVTDAASRAALDEVVTALVRAFDGLTLALLQTTISPQTALTQWLSAVYAEDIPGEFSIERACELRSGDEEKSVVKFNRHNLVTEEVRKHISEGKLPKWAAMSYAGRLSFVLDDCMRIKKITFLEGVFDGRPDEDADGFDADIALSTGELQKLIPDLVKALGGELVERTT